MVLPSLVTDYKLCIKRTTEASRISDFSLLTYRFDLTCLLVTAIIHNQVQLHCNADSNIKSKHQLNNKKQVSIKHTTYSDSRHKLEEQTDEERTNE